MEDTYYKLRREESRSKEFAEVQPNVEDVNVSMVEDSDDNDPRAQCTRMGPGGPGLPSWPQGGRGTYDHWKGGPPPSTGLGAPPQNQNSGEIFVHGTVLLVDSVEKNEMPVDGLELEDTHKQPPTILRKRKRGGRWKYKSTY